MAQILIGTATTDANGQFTFSNLPFGTYKLVQTSALTGYNVESNIPDITVSSTTPVSVDCENSPINVGSMKISKTVENYPDWPLKDCVYKLMDSNNKTVKTATSTDVNGEITFNNLMTTASGVSYKIQETATPSGYTLDSTVVTVPISINTEADVDRTNAPSETGEFTTTLADTTYSEYTMPGAEFEVYAVV